MPRKPKPPEDFLYQLQTGAESYIVQKYDSIGMEMLSQYIMPIIEAGYDEGGDFEIQVSCTCPRGLAPSCRHRDMLPKLLPIIDQPGQFYCFGHDRYVRIEGGEMRVGLTSSPEPMQPTLHGAPISQEALDTLYPPEPTSEAPKPFIRRV